MLFIMWLNLFKVVNIVFVMVVVNLIEVFIIVWLIVFSLWGELMN